MYLRASHFYPASPLLALLLVSANAPAAVDLEASYFEGREIIERSVLAHGGTERLQAFAAIALEYRGDVAAVFQGANPDSPHRRLERTGSIRFDVSRDALDSLVETRWPDFTQTSRILVVDGAGYSVETATQTYRTTDAGDVTGTWRQRLIPVIFRTLLEHMSSVGYVGETGRGDSRLQVVRAVGPAGNVLYLHFSSRDHLLRRIEYLGYLPDLGDTVTALVFSDYTEVEGYRLPTRMQRLANGVEVMDYVFDNLRVNAAADIALPEGYDETPTGNRPPPPAMTTREIVEDTWLIENLANRDYNVLIVEMKDYITVFEAPLDDEASRMVLEEIRKVAPDKPVRYVMLTHFHGDHTGGIRTYMHDGATLITTPGNRKYFEDVARFTHTLGPESVPAVEQLPRFALLRDGSLTLDDGNRSIRFVDIGPTAHADEMIVAYLPGQQLLFQGDLFRVPPAGAEPQAARSQAVELHRYVTREGLPVRQLVGAHGPVGTLNDLSVAVRLRGSGIDDQPDL